MDLPLGLKAQGENSFGYRAALGAAYDFATAAVDRATRPSEMSVFFTQKFSRTAKLNFYLLRGLSDASPDWGGGIKYTHAF